MRITDLVWLDELVEKIEAKHGVFQGEVDEVFSRKPKIRKMKKDAFEVKMYTVPWGGQKRDAIWLCSLFTNAQGLPSF